MLPPLPPSVRNDLLVCSSPNGASLDLIFLLRRLRSSANTNLEFSSALASASLSFLSYSDCKLRLTTSTWEIRLCMTGSSFKKGLRGTVGFSGVGFDDGSLRLARRDSEPEVTIIALRSRKSTRVWPSLLPLTALLREVAARMSLPGRSLWGVCLPSLSRAAMAAGAV